MSREAQLLDELEDAQDQFDRITKLQRIGIIGVSICFPLCIAGIWVLSYLHSLGVDFGDSSGAPNVLLLLASVVFLVGLYAARDVRANAKATLKAAQRNHRNYLMKGWEDHMKIKAGKVT